MEIPYEVKARPDTGLWNAKIGIWLFLASEVMLFGGLFSGYVFLRLGTGADPDYHWPHGLLNVTLGFVNTLVLIASSVFVVFAWVKLKLRDWNGFRLWMILVLLCSAAFLVIKSFEDDAKFKHFGVKLSDKTIIEGHHLHDDLEYDAITKITLKLPITDYRINDIAHGEADGNLFFRLNLQTESEGSLAENPPAPNQIPAKDAAWEAEQFASGGDKPSHYVEIYYAADASAIGQRSDILSHTDSVLTTADAFTKLAEGDKFRIRKHGAKAELLASRYVNTDSFFEDENIRGIFKDKGYKLSPEEAKEINDAYAVFEKNVSGAFELTKAKAKEIKASADAYTETKMAPLERVRKIEYDAFLKANPGELTEEQETTLKALIHPVKFYSAAGEQTLDLEPVSEDGQTVKPFSVATRRSKLRTFAENGATLYDQTAIAGKLSAEKRFLSLDVDNIDLRSTPVPENSIIWKYMDHHAKEEFIKHRDEVNAAAKEDGKEPDIAKSLISHQEKHDGHYATVKVPLDEVTLYSNFTPKWNTYLAVYFTLTGLHGLHVLIGALVLAYFLFFGKKMFDEDPEHLANRVEVGGLFWHFVDLVWIFLFPILYLM